MEDALSSFRINGNQETTYESTYKKEILSEINYTQDLPEDIFPINLKLIDQYQRKDPILLDIYTTGNYQDVYFLGGINKYLNLRMCEGNYCYYINTRKLCITMVQYVSSSSING